MDYYTCKSCKYDFNAGFLNLNYCPKCFGWFSQIKDMLKVFVKIILPFVIAPIAVAMLVLFFASRPLFNTIKNSSQSALNTTTLFSESKDVYLDSIIRSTGRTGAGR